MAVIPTVDNLNVNNLNRAVIKPGGDLSTLDWGKANANLNKVNNNGGVLSQPTGSNTTTTASNSNVLSPSSNYTPTKVTAASYQGATYNPTSYQTTVMDPNNVSRATASKATTTNAQASAAQAAMAQAYTYDAYKQQVQQNELAQYHLNNMLASNSDYIKRAKTEGAQYAQSRGILNTTMGAGAAHGAAIDRAAPIATNDANTYAKRAETHIAEENTARRTNATNKTNVSMANANNQTQTNISNADRSTQVSLANADAKNKASITNANNATQVSQSNAAEENAFWKQYIQNENDASKYNADASNTASQFNAGSINTAEQFNTLQQNNIALANMGADNEMAKLAITENNDNWRFMSDQQFQGVQAGLNRDLERYRIDSSTKADISARVIDAIGQLNNNPDLTPTAKQELANNIFAGAGRAALLMQDLDALTNGTLSQSDFLAGFDTNTYAAVNDKPMGDVTSRKPDGQIVLNQEGKSGNQWGQQNLQNVKGNLPSGWEMKY